MRLLGRPVSPPLPLPSSQLCSPPEGSGGARGPQKHQPLDQLGFAITVSLLFHIPFCHLWGKETKGSQNGGWGVSASPTLTLSPAQRRCSHQKRLLKDDSFYFFSLTFPSLGKQKTKTKNNHNNNKKKKKGKKERKKKKTKSTTKKMTKKKKSEPT